MYYVTVVAVIASLMLGGRLKCALLRKPQRWLHCALESAGQLVDGKSMGCRHTCVQLIACFGKIDAIVAVFKSCLYALVAIDSVWSGKLRRAVFR